MIDTYLDDFGLSHEKPNFINDLVLQELDSTTTYLLPLVCNMIELVKL